MDPNKPRSQASHMTWLQQQEGGLLSDKPATGRARGFINPGDTLLMQYGRGVPFPASEPSIGFARGILMPTSEDGGLGSTRGLLLLSAEPAVGVARGVWSLTLVKLLQGSSLVSMFRGMGIEPSKTFWGRGAPPAGRSSPDITGNNVAYGHKPTVAGPDRTGKKCSSLTSRGFVSPGVMVGFAFIVVGMSVTPRPVLWSGIDLEVEGPSWSGAVKPLQKIGTKGITLHIGSNHITIGCRNEAVYQYHVTFTPKAESMGMRFVVVKVQMTKILTPHSDLCIPFYNVVLRRLMRILGLKHVGRNHYVPKSEVILGKHREVWPGYSMCRKHTDGGLKVIYQKSRESFRDEDVCVIQVHFLCVSKQGGKMDFRAMKDLTMHINVSSEQHTHSLKQLLKNTNPEAQTEILPLETVCLQSASFVTGADSVLHVQPNVQLVVCIMTGNRDYLYCAIKKLYCAIKKLYCVQSPVPSQVDTKILLQMNCKLGGELWTVNIPLVILLMSVFALSKKNRSAMGFVASLNSMLTRWYTRVTFQMPNEEVINGFRMCLLAALQKYYVVAGAQVCQELQSCWVSRSTISRPKGHPANLSPGTVLDHTVTNRDWVYFYLMAHHIQQGCGLPTHYISIYNMANLSPDHLQRLTFKMCHVYWNWPWTIQVPAPCKYGLKLAYLSGQYLHSEPAIQLADKPYFLLSLSPPRRSTPVCTTINRSQLSKS
uniref:Piwi-like RNA-mediated gene silencing 2 n=1 Tax=Hucho hucho TaxID=62062 RepID=A0A4W5M0Q7_9TELE